MPENKRYRCLSCGERFELEVLTHQDFEDARKRGEYINHSPIECPKCKRRDFREGWE
jgi:DNA-directed RNA polymerase subunit RPC12/RpoP